MAEQSVTETETAGQMPSLLHPHTEGILEASCALLPDGGESLLNYLRYGLPPGSFLQAVLSNDLAEACNRGDDQHRQALPYFVRILVNAAPMEAWGSREKVKAWIAAGAEMRRTWNAERQQ